jgi:WD repeat and SOF domain-containing protein 1
VISGSDDGNVRIWKAKASDKLGIITARERAAMEYRESLKERWGVDAEVNRVMRYAPNLVSFSLTHTYRSSERVICQNLSSKQQN